MTSELFIAICAGVTLLIYFTASMVGLCVAVFRKIDTIKTEILADVNEKHKENRNRVDALQTLVIRHDTILAPEFDGHFSRGGQ
jgi:hypothetical protein